MSSEGWYSPLVRLVGDLGRQLHSAVDDDDGSSYEETNQFKYTLLINFVIFIILVTVFEVNRGLKSIYMSRIKSKYIESNRVPPKPGTYPFAWIGSVLNVNDDTELLEMIGLDGYMLIRYIKACLNISLFITFFCLLIMVPVYSRGDAGRSGWSKFTVANIKEEADARTLWLPCIFAYIFSFYFCYIMYNEYKFFLTKRIQYLLKGDSDTHPQTYYTVMIEKVPVPLRNPKVFKSFFSRLFPNDVYSIEFAVDLKEIDVLCAERSKMRYELEKALAVVEATSVRPMVHLKATTYSSSSSGSEVSDVVKQPIPQTTGWVWTALGYVKYDAIDHYYYQLTMLNKSIEQLQEVYVAKINDSHQEETVLGNNDVVGRVEVGILSAKKKVTTFFSYFTKNNSENDEQEADLLKNDTITQVSTLKPATSAASMSNPLNATVDPERKSDSGDGSEGLQLKSSMYKGRNTIQTLAKSGFSAVTGVTRSTLHGILEASRTLELLTVGAYYNVSSTAFVTFSSRVTVCQAQKLLLSHGYSKLRVKAAPNPDDVIWRNLTIPEKQYQARRHVANIFFAFGAISWSAVITCITAISNLESLSNQKGFHWLQPLRSNQFFIFVNNYLALGLLLIILAFLPALFDLSAVRYEGYKVVSEVQNIIMTRYFYYQIANIYVSVGFGSITSGITQIINNPGNILNVLGYYIASFSVYFANLVVIKTFTGLPVEFLRLWPLIQLGFYTLFRDKNKCTRRELASGPFAKPQFLYGWIYPNLLMILMIMCVYCCIAPFIMPFVVVFYMFTYLMYKYQLLYIFMTNYQAGGFMWYSVFNRSMTALIGGMLTLLCYMGIRETYLSGPFYVLIPLPLLLMYFTSKVEKKFKELAENLSLEQALDIDHEVVVNSNIGVVPPHQSFQPHLYRQVSLKEACMKPAHYRSTSAAGSTTKEPSIHRITVADTYNVPYNVEPADIEYENEIDTLNSLEGVGVNTSTTSSVTPVQVSSEKVAEIDEILDTTPSTRSVRARTLRDVAKYLMKQVKQDSNDMSE